MPEFAETIATAYAVEGLAIDLGRGVHEGAVAPEAVVQVPLAMMNRHGLVAGATGTGKTKTIQGIAEQLSAAGVPVFVADVKGDVSGLAAAGDARGAGAEADGRSRALPYEPAAFPVEFLSLGGIGPGVPGPRDGYGLRPPAPRQDPRCERDAGAEPCARLSLRRRAGAPAPRPVRPARAAHLPRLGPGQGGAQGDRRSVVADDRRAAARAGRESRTAAATEFFGEPQLEIADLLRTLPTGEGSSPASSCRRSRTSRGSGRRRSCGCWPSCSRSYPRSAISEKPKLVFFFDEAHLLFSGATDAFIESVVTTVRMIRSKGVGVFFSTQVPKDVHEDVLAQLGNRIQHALRAFTPEDAKALKAADLDVPEARSFYDLEELLPSLGIGEAAVTILSEDGVPTPVVHTRMRAPASRMAPADDVDGAAAGLAALREVRHPDRCGERPREARRPPRGARARVAGGGPEAVPAGEGGGQGDAARRRSADRLPHLTRGKVASAPDRSRGVRAPQKTSLTLVPVSHVRCSRRSAGGRSSRAAGATGARHDETSRRRTAPPRRSPARRRACSAVKPTIREWGNGHGWLPKYASFAISIAGLLAHLADDALLERLARVDEARQRRVDRLGEAPPTGEQDLVAAGDAHDDGRRDARVGEVAAVEGSAWRARRAADSVGDPQRPQKRCVSSQPTIWSARPASRKSSSSAPASSARRPGSVAPGGSSPSLRKRERPAVDAVEVAEVVGAGEVEPGLAAARRARAAGRRLRQRGSPRPGPRASADSRRRRPRGLDSGDERALTPPILGALVRRALAERPQTRGAGESANGLEGVHQAFSRRPYSVSRYSTRGGRDRTRVARESCRLELGQPGGERSRRDLSERVAELVEAHGALLRRVHDREQPAALEEIRRPANLLGHRCTPTTPGHACRGPGHPARAGSHASARRAGPARAPARAPRRGS